jgi:hypothetical protein
MSEPITNEPEVKDPNAELRAFNDRLKEENAALRTRTLEADIRNIGLDPKIGLGVAVAELYQGDFSDGSVAAFAQEKFGHAGETAEPAPSMQEAQKAESIVEAQSLADRVLNTSSSIDVTPELDNIAAMDRKLGSPEATRDDAIAAVDAKRALFREQLGM